MIETPLDDCVAYGFQAIPGFDTQVVTLDNGQEQRNGNWTRPKHEYTARYQNFTRVQFAILLACFMAARGKLYAFLFKDPFDFEATDQSQGVAPSGSTPVQLRKTYSFGLSTTFVRYLTKIIPGSVTMYQDNGSGVFVAKPGTTDNTTGFFTPSTAWTAGRALRATFQFYVPVRFKSDQFPSTYDDIDAINTDCELVEVFGE